MVGPKVEKKKNVLKAAGRRERNWDPGRKIQ